MVSGSKPQFSGVTAAAANIGRETGGYTPEMFTEDFPQFLRLNSPMQILPLEEFVKQANTAIQPDKWLDGWRYACGLYTAHCATLYLRTVPDDAYALTPSQLAAMGSGTGIVKSAQLGDSSVTYDTSALTAATERWGDLNATQYGQLLASRARLAGMGGTYVL